MSPSTSTRGFTINARALAAQRYHPSSSNQPIDLWLDSNEGLPPPEEWLTRVAAQANAAIARYPRAASLERTVARIADVSPERVVVTAGADDALERICRCVLEPGTSIVLAEPTFEMVRRYAALAGAEVRSFPWLEQAFDREALLACVDETTRAIYLASPNNPTGQVITPDDVTALSRAAPHVLLILDLAYIEFADVDLQALALTLPNVVVTRTMSKAWGLAGLRIGWAIGPVELIERLRAVGQPFAASGVSLAIAERWLDEGRPFVQARIDRIKQERDELAATIRALGGDPIESHGNFVLACFERAEGLAHQLADHLASRGIAVRRFPSDRSTASYLRITCPGDPKAFERLLNALRSAIGVLSNPAQLTERLP